jgi:hypothetical protein
MMSLAIACSRITRHICFSPAVIVISLFSSTVYAQSSVPGNGFGIEANMMAGKLIKHTQKIKGPIPERSAAFEINLVQQTNGSKAWQQRRHYPLWGVGFMYTDYGNDAVYGKCIGMYPNLQIPLVRGKHLEWTMRAGFGIGYVTRRFERDPGYDTLNTAIGSHVNNFTVFSTDLRYHASTHLDIQAGFNFSHMSNAALKQPNLGLNMYGAHIGIRYSPVTSKPERISQKLNPLKNRWLLQGRYSMAFTESGSANGPLYPVYMGAIFASKRWHSKNKMFIGLDYSYHTSIEAFLKNNEIYPGDEKAHSWKSAVFVGNEFLFGKVGIVLQVGYYLKEATLRQDPYYEKLGGNFYLVQKEKGFLKELFLSALLKTHKTQAELAEIGIGFGL